MECSSAEVQLQKSLEALAPSLPESISEHVVCFLLLSNSSLAVTMNLEDEIKDKLPTRKLIKIPESAGGGCISSGVAYDVDDGQIFVKKSNRLNAMEMFEGEFYSLKKISETKCVRVPEVHCIVTDPSCDNGAALITEYLDMKPLKIQQGKLGENLAKMHLHNSELKKKYLYDSNFLGKQKNNDIEHVDQFGFDTVTNCGHIALMNEWCDDWVSFFARNRLDYQIQMLGSRTVNELWSVLQIKLPKFFQEFKDREIIIEPSLLHGDLWSGNAAEIEDEPVIFDPACFYGHNEFDLSIADLFGGFHPQFYENYFETFKKVPGFEQRTQLYQLFHLLNHWNHFGSGYSDKSINMMKKLNKMF